MTGRAPAEFILGRLPRTRLSLIHPCIPQRMSIAIEERVGHKAPRCFNEGQEVLLRDLCLNAPQKWRHAVISCKQGPLTYTVVVDGQVRQAHADHLQPCPEHDVKPDNLQENQGTQDAASAVGHKDTANIRIPSTNFQ